MKEMLEFIIVAAFCLLFGLLLATHERNEKVALGEIKSALAVFQDSSCYNSKVRAHLVNATKALE